MNHKAKLTVVASNVSTIKKLEDKNQLKINDAESQELKKNSLQSHINNSINADSVHHH